MCDRNAGGECLENAFTNGHAGSDLPTHAEFRSGDRETGGVVGCLACGNVLVAIRPSNEDDGFDELVTVPASALPQRQVS